MLELDVSPFSFPAADGATGLASSVIRCRPKADTSRSESFATSPGGRLRLSLILAHAVGTHKETWLPTVEHLFEIQRCAPNNAFTIVEAWALDFPQHGDAARLNEKKLLLDLSGGLNNDHWCTPIRALFSSGLVAGDRVVGIGHSAGIVSLILAFAKDRLPYASIVMIEPPMMTEEILKHAQEVKLPMIRAIDAARTRKDVWPSRDAARDWFSRQLPWRRWDPRVLDLYVKHALRDLPTVTYPERTEGVTLACTRAQESVGYTNFDSCFETLARLPDLCAALPVHCVFGEIVDQMPKAVHEAAVSEEDGRRMKSIVTVTGAGHLAVQDKPYGVALALWGILHEDYGGRRGAAASKL